MSKNMGTADRVIRALIAVVLGVFVATGQITGGWAIVVGLVALVLLLTSAVSICPGYWPLRISTRGRGDQPG
jgi:hypothetical protein